MLVLEKDWQKLYLLKEQRKLYENFKNLLLLQAVELEQK